MINYFRGSFIEILEDTDIWCLSDHPTFPLEGLRNTTQNSGYLAFRRLALSFIAGIFILTRTFSLGAFNKY